MRTVAVIALKGGSGKTTVATHLALAAHLRGVETLVADIDPQRSAYSVLSAREASGPDSYITTTGSKLMAAKFAALGLKQGTDDRRHPRRRARGRQRGDRAGRLCRCVVRPTLLDIAGLARTPHAGAPPRQAVDRGGEPGPDRAREYRASVGQARPARPRLHAGAPGPGHPALPLNLPDRPGDRPLGGGDGRRRRRPGDRRPLDLHRRRGRRHGRQRNGSSAASRRSARRTAARSRLPPETTQTIGLVAGLAGQGGGQRQGRQPSAISVAASSRPSPASPGASRPG